jgi:formate hydrogenlyase subunit 4
MRFAAGLLALALHTALLAAAAPLLAGLMAVLRARLLGLAAPPPFQAWRDLLRLVRKQPVLAEGASALAAAAPWIAFAATAAAALLVPSCTSGMAGAAGADLIAVFGLLALARAALVLAALDAGAPFGGLGAARVLGLDVAAAPALLLVVLALALAAGSTNIDAIAGINAIAGSAGPAQLAALPLVAAALGLVALVETGLVPGEAGCDEAAMIAGAPPLDVAGWHLALVEAAAQLRLLLWLDLLGVAVFPAGMATADGGALAWAIGVACWLARTVVLAAALAAWQAARVRVPLARGPAILGLAAVLGLLAALALFATEAAA